MRLSRLAFLLVLLPAVAFSETDQERQAREDLERQLKSMVGTPPTKIRIELIGLDQPNYELVEVSFKLDGRNLPVSDLKRLNSDGTHLIFHGDVEPGEHRLESRFEFRNLASQVVSAEGGYKWKPGSEVTFRTDSGIEAQIKVTPELSLGGDIKNRITVRSPVTVKMLAKLDDGKMPEPAERPNLVIAEVDAGVPAAVVVVKAETAKEKAAALAEAKKKAREEALEAKKAAAEEKKRAVEEARAARLAAASEKKRAADEAKAARLEAAAEKKRAAAEAVEEKKRAAAEAVAAKSRPPVADEPRVVALEKPVEVDAGAAVVAGLDEVDAGPAVVAVAPEPVKPVIAAPVEEESGLPLPVFIGIGVAVVGLLLFLVARRKKS